MPHQLEFLLQPFVVVPLAAVACFLLSIRIYPVIIHISQVKKLMDEPGDRSSHGVKTPTLGGVGMFVSFSITLLLAGLLLAPAKAELYRILAVMAAGIILVFLGIKDDLLVLSPRKKFLGQLFASLITILLTDLRITGFGEILWIGELPYLLSVLFTVFVFMTIINAFNLIDGVDGLAGSQAGLATLFFGVYFFLNDQFLYALLSFALLGCIIGFLRYNFSITRKLFMGDSGSLFLGFMLAFQGVVFLSVNIASPAAHLPSAPIMLLAVLSFPLLDCLRVFVIRLKDGKSPFSADRNHIHHRFLQIGFSHKQTTAAICVSTLVLVVYTWLMGSWDKHLQLLLGTAFACILYLYPYRFGWAIRANDPEVAESPEKTTQGNARKYPGEIPRRRKAVYQKALEATTEKGPLRAARGTAISKKQDARFEP